MSAYRPARLLAALIALTAFLALPGVAQAEQLRGVHLHSLWPENSDSDMDGELDLAYEAGANAVRVDVVWGSLETGGRGQFSDWYVKKMDRFVERASARGLKVIANLWSSPCWASSAPETAKQGCSGAWWDRGVGAYPPVHGAHYGEAARFITSRYGTKLAALEVWNEPNADEQSFWKSPDKAGDYARLLKAAYPKAKAGNPNVPVIAGATAFADRKFFEDLYANGIKGYQDGLSFHPYNEARHPGDRWKSEWKKYTLLPGIESIRELQRSKGDEKPLWATEFGWSTGTQSGWKVSEAQQAEYIRDSFPLLANIPYLKGAIVYNLREKGNSQGSHEDNFGLVKHDFSPKPAYAALKDALGGRAGSRAPGLRLRLRRHRGKVLVVGRSSRRGRVRIKVSRCRDTKRVRRLTVRTSGRRNSFRRRLGRSARLRGCRVTGKLVGRRTRAVSARVPRSWRR